MSSALRITKFRGGYHLMDGKEIAATLTLHNMRASRATIASKERRWELSHRHILKRGVEVRDEGGQSVSIFCSNWDCRGEVHLHGHHYSWKPLNQLWTQWGWFDEQGNKIIALRTKRQILDMEGEVNTHSVLSDHERNSLALLGWHMLLLQHLEPEALVLSGIESSFRKLLALGK